MKKVNVLWLKAKTAFQTKLSAVMQSGPAAMIVGLLLLLVATVVVVAIMVAAFALLFMLPGMILGGAFWIGWTYAGLGAAFFPTLDPQWLTIGYWPTAFFTSVLVFLVKMVRGSGKKKTEAGVIDSENYEPGQRGYRLRK